MKEMQAVLRRYGFKRLKQYHNEIIPYQKGEDPKTCLYAEILIYKNFKIVWIVGEGIPNKIYPGGSQVNDASELKQLLSSIQ